MNKLWTSFKKFHMGHLSARSNLVNFCSTKNLTSNGSKPIRVLTRTKSSCSDERLPIGYLLPDFQPIWSNFLNHFTSVHFTSVQLPWPGTKGVDTLGGSPPNHPWGDCVHDTWTNAAVVLQSKDFLPWWTEANNAFFSCRHQPTSLGENIYKILHRCGFWSFRLFWSLFYRKTLPKSFRDNFNKNSPIEVFMWSIHDFFCQFGKTLWSIQKTIIKWS